MPTFSLILATRDRTTELHQFFAALYTSGQENCECIVVDQNPDQRLMPVLFAWSDRINIKHLRSTCGLSHARNAGLKVASGEVLSFPDDDCWYSPDLLLDVAGFFAQNPDYAMLSVGVRDQTGALSGNRWMRSRCDLTTANLFRTSVGIALFVRRSQVTDAVRFDESLGVGAGTTFASGEDTDYVFRLMDAGLKGRFDQRLTVFHPRHDMLSGGANAGRAFSYGCGMGRVIRKQARLPLFPAFVAFDFLRMGLSILRGRLGSASLCAAHMKGLFAGYLAPQ
jgi:GT2 family glycosyltransferase